MVSCDVKEQTIESQRSQNINNSQQSTTEQNTNLQNFSSENINSKKDVDDYGLKPEQLPSTVRAELDNRFSGWRFPKVDEGIHRYLRENISADIHPEFISGDFDGNGQLDYAVMIEHGVALGEDGNPVGHNTYVVAFLKNGNKLKFYMVHDGGEYITLMKKGEKDYDYATDKNFIYKNDAIFSGYFEKAGVSYIYEKGKFRGITTSD
jgi:hypothetical protein